MRDIKKLLQYHIYDKKKSFIVFWIVVILANIMFYYLNSRFSGTYGTIGLSSFKGVESEVSVAGGNIIAIAIYIIVYNMEMYYEDFPTAISFSSTRKQFYKSAVVHNIIICMAMAVVEAILIKVDRYIIKAIGREPLLEFGNFNVQQDNIVFIILMIFLLAIVFCALFNLLGTILYKYGYKVWIFLGIIFTALGNINGVFGLIKSLIDSIFSYNNFIIYSAKVSLTAAFLYYLGWLIVSKINIRNAK